MAEQNKFGQMPDATRGSGGLKLRRMGGAAGRMRWTGCCRPARRLRSTAHSGAAGTAPICWRTPSRGRSGWAICTPSRKSRAGWSERFWRRRWGGRDSRAGDGRRHAGARSNCCRRTPGTELPRDPAADDRGHGILLDRDHSEHGGRKAEATSGWPICGRRDRQHAFAAVLRSAAPGGAVLRQHALCVSAAVEDARTAARLQPRRSSNSSSRRSSNSRTGGEEWERDSARSGAGC